MNVRRAITIIAGFTLGGALLGASLGLMLGAFAPGYYRTVFRMKDSPDFNAVQVGVGLGVTQGLVGGLIVACIVVLAIAIYTSRRRSILREIFGDDIDGSSMRE